ncbi:hypothetical protein CDAR_372021 [Caerostris darwini]|uniref:Uncharacterized protein n=1 Tax=Caerostris darwini TaxID=1538125 RepID=A0AAV4W0A8_9ARAC|nr:hypothetical protein CDAR_372021 [Caerostris darwini]
MGNNTERELIKLTKKRVLFLIAHHAVRKADLCRPRCRHADGRRFCARSRGPPPPSPQKRTRPARPIDRRHHRQGARTPAPRMPPSSRMRKP